LDRYPTLPNGAGGCFSANRTGKDAPANTGQAARRYAIDSSAPDQVFKKEFCSSDPSIALASSSEVIEAFSSRTGAYTSTRAGVPFVCRHLIRHAPKRQSGDSATASIQKGTDWSLFCDHYVGTKKWNKI
jgi:hypothetical protein